VRILIAGGGTAGHVFPAIAVARKLVDDHGADVAFLGTAAGLEARLVPAAGFDLIEMQAKPLLRKASLATLRAPFVALSSMRRCRPIVQEADAVLGMGGYVSGPPVVAAWRSKTPVVLHEQNAIPGLANRLASRVARVTALAFAEAAKAFPRRARTEVTGNPIRDVIATIPAERPRFAEEAYAELDLERGRRTVVIFGGSQGALHIDRAAVGACTLLRERGDLQIVLLTGPAHHEATKRGLPDAAALRVRTLPFLDRMELAYSVADLVVSRAGATTVAEVAAAGVPSVLVPYPYATANHQEANARALQRAGGASVVLDDQLTAEVLAERIESMVDHEERLGSMSERATAWARPDAAAVVAGLVARAAGEES
jgi:UDP-N-acetylglucosamine--N-acetylmuramyl-(pentapeptide) pyrophosphoryl-undecaprenol N-acetylglucosamine transferase